MYFVVKEGKNIGVGQGFTCDMAEVELDLTAAWSRLKYIDLIYIATNDIPIRH